MIEYLMLFRLLNLRFLKHLLKPPKGWYLMVDYSISSQGMLKCTLDSHCSKDLKRTLKRYRR